MRRAPLFAFFLLASKIGLAGACSPVLGWLPPTPTSAFAESEVVVQVQVISQESDELHYNTSAKVRIIKLLKGKFSGDTVITSGSSLCGVGTFTAGQEYVFFFPHTGRWFVSNLVQPTNATTEQILGALDAAKK